MLAKHDNFKRRHLSCNLVAYFFASTTIVIEDFALRCVSKAHFENKTNDLLMKLT